MDAVFTSRPSRLLAFAAAGAMLCTLPGCPKKGTPSEQIATSPDFAAETGQAKCGVRASAAKPLVVEWPAADRGALEARAQRGLVAVRYQGCEMEVLTNCTVDGAYSYLGLNPKREGVRIKNVDELYAQLPVGAVSLEGKLERAGQLNVDMVIIGRKEAERAQFNERDLEGRCSEATHVITGLTVGAFSFYAGASAEVGAGVKVGNIGAGASSGTEREVLKQDGDEDACSAASQTDADAPPGCGALLRVEVVPIDRMFGSANVAATSAGSGTTGSGSSNPAPFSGSSGSSSSGSSPTDTGHAVWDDKDQRQLRTWTIVSIVGYGMALGGYGALYGGVFVKKKGETELAVLNSTPSELPPGSERQASISKVKTGIGLLIGGAVGGTLGLALGVVGSARAKQLRDQRRRSTIVGPLLLPEGGGVAASVRF